MTPDEVAELRRLKYIEAELDIERTEHGATKQLLNAERLKNAHLKEMMDGLVDDLSQMEAQIRELTPDVPADDSGDLAFVPHSQAVDGGP